MQKLLVVLLILGPLLSKAQKDYPYAILPGAQQTAGATSDTLWVMKHSQMQKAIVAAKENKILKEQIVALNEKIALMGNRGGVQDSLTFLYRDKAEHYEKQWRECDNDLQIVAKQYKKQRILTYVASAGIVASLLLGVFLF
jgi:hypothetical protein